MSESNLTPPSPAGASAAKPMALLSVLITVALIIVLGLATYVIPSSGPLPSQAGTDSVALRIAKVGSVAVQIQHAARATPATGEEVYKAQCSACHAAGVTGAPKFGNAADWGPRIATGQATLEQAPIKGFTGKVGTMPPQSGGAFTDYEIMRAVVYMANAGGAKFEEPPAPASTASAAQ